MNPTTARFLCRTGTYSIDEARRMLGYEPTVNLAEGTESVREWLDAEAMQ